MFFFNFSEKLDFKKFKRMEIPNLVVGHCEGTLRSCKLQVLQSNLTAEMLFFRDGIFVMSF